MTQILPAHSSQAIKLARRLLREGEVVALPTDTVYGLGANAFERIAVRQIFKLKQRPPDKPIPVFIYQIDDLNLVARHVPNRAWPLLQEFWPGPLTVVLPKVAALPDDVTVGQDTVAVRIPDHPVSLELVIKFGRPLAVTSANLSGQPTPPTAQGVADQLGPALPLVLDGGPSPSSQPSTIIDLSTDPPRLLRQGPITIEALRPFLPNLK
ncbi:MAG: threonylcarbamoyl-AMP synthase [Anaerolineae bacterium]|nr:threonylcarbamoyl-AMP synthase [Anaerolineae bacterium]MCB9107418.1 threonylcarbamoyl-AMP synthase [Anaerolineales bacterium]